MKSVYFYSAMLIICTLFPSLASSQATDEVVALVQQTKTDIENNTDVTLGKILAGEHPYRDTNNPSLYVFVLDENLNVAAHAIKPQTVGRNLKGKPDTKGKMFRDEMQEKALKDGKGWVDYYYLNPKTKQTTHKESYFELAQGNNGTKYIVGSGKYVE
jgi:signal transduction histidine kinase